MTVAVQCPDRASLERLLEQGGAPGEIERLASHLETCARCGESVEGLLAADRTASALRGATVPPDESSIQLLRARLANLRPPAGATAAQEATVGAADATGAVVPPPVEMTQEQRVPLAPPQQPDEIGRLGGYRILKELGRGGMGVVYQAEDVKLKRLVALKAMLPNLAADAAARQRFLREAQSMAAVRHDHIVTIFQVDEAGGVPFLAMEFLEGKPLDQWLKDGRKPTLPQLLRLGREIAAGLAAAHERGLIHRDVKPGNIWLDSTQQGRVKILDFGLARAGQEDVHLTRSGAIVGTPAYMAPEQARGEKVDARCDLFSLGCVLYKLCTGAMPFTGDNTMSLLMSLALDHPKPVREINTDIPPALSDLVMKLLEKDPARRPASAREVVQALQALDKKLARKQEVEDRTEAVQITAPAPERSAAIAALPTASRAVPPRRRTGALVGLLLGGAVAAAAVVAIIIIVRNSNGDKVGEVTVPPGGKVEVVDDGKKGDAGVAPKPPLDDAWIKQVAALRAEKQVEAVAAKLKELNPGFDGKADSHIEYSVVRDLMFFSDDVTDISAVRALPELKYLFCGQSDRLKGRLADLSPLRGMKLTGLCFQLAQVSDLSPLKGMPLTTLAFAGTPVSELSPLKGMPLTSLECMQTQVSDLSPLKGMPLTSLRLNNTPVSDLSPLKDMKLASLWFGGTPVSDLSPLKGMPLTTLECSDTKVADLSPLKDMKLARLWFGNTPVSDLSPLKGMPLTSLDFGHTPVSDLSPLKGMPLTTLECSDTKVADLSPLKGMPLTNLRCFSTPVSDLSPLKGMPLTSLGCGGTRVTDLSPLKGVPLKELWCDFKPERDAEILRSIKTLEKINDKPAAEFWKDVDAKKP